jgi:hypothetical protein
MNASLIRGNAILSKRKQFGLCQSGRILGVVPECAFSVWMQTAQRTGRYRSACAHFHEVGAANAISPHLYSFGISFAPN